MAAYHASLAPSLAEQATATPFYRILSPFADRAVESEEHSQRLLRTRPLAPLLLPNTSSDARDHCANERTFLSWLRLSVYMAVVGIAIIISFHLKHQPTPLEQRLALPFGLVFWTLSMACLLNGTLNYFQTVKKYARRQALVQAGWKTQFVFTIVTTTIVAACILFLSTNVAKA